MKKGVRKKKATSEVGPACRAGLSSTARTASERTSIERRRLAPGSTNVAVSLRRDEPFGTRLCAIWPVIFHYAFTCGGVHGVSQVKERGLITAERDGYICCLNVTTLPINQPAFGLRSRHVTEVGSEESQDENRRFRGWKPSLLSVTACGVSVARNFANGRRHA